MKLIIALALFAVAFAELQVVPLPEAPIPVYGIPDIRQLIVPQEVIDAIKMMAKPVMRDAEVAEDLLVRFVDAPLDAPVESDLADEQNPDLRIQVVDAVDAPVESDVAQDFDAGLEVHFVDWAPIAEEIAAPDAVQIRMPVIESSDVAAPEIIAPDAVRIAEAPLPALESANEIADESFVPEPVRIAEAPLPALESANEIAHEESFVPEPVRIAEAPLPAFESADEIAHEESFVPEPVMIAEAPLPAVEAINEPAVEAVKIAVPRFPGKQFADPRLR